MRVVGLGAQDSLALAEDFLDATGVTTPLMVWDESFQSWSHFGVSAQPVAILVDPEGNALQEWRGAFDEDEVLRLAAEV